MHPPVRFVCLVLCALLCLSFFYTRRGSATTTFTVNDTGDTPDATLDGTCADSNGKCTLRAAIAEANSVAGADTINITATGTIQLTGALPSLSTDIDINGPGARLLTVRRDTGGNYRIFTVTSGVTVNISGLTVTNGRTANGAPAQPGAGIRNDGTLTLTGVAVSGNQTGQGAGCANCQGGNGGDGGGVANNGTLNLFNSTVSGNQTGVGGTGLNVNGVGGNGGAGGGIVSNGTLTITNSTVSGNQTSGGGTGNLGNGVGGSGGGIHNSGGTLTVSNSTITANSANNSGGGINMGGGVSTLRSSIVAGNSSATVPDISGTVQSDGFNLIGDTSGATITPNAGAGPNITGVAPQLNALANNGGPTDTHSLKFNSPAIDKGNAFGAATDQRGRTRPFNLPEATEAAGGDASDIGAFEMQTDDPQSPLVVNSTGNTSDTNTSDGLCDSNAGTAGEQCTLRAAIQEANARPGTNTINFDPIVFAAATTITITNGLPDITSNVNITGRGEALLNLSGTGGSIRLFTVSGGATLTLEAMTLSGSSTNNGGALLNNGGTLTVSHVSFTGNTSLNTTAGGAIYNSIGVLTVDHATFTGNTAGGSGGAIHCQTGSVLVRNSTFANNTSNATTAATGGGAIYMNSGTSLKVIGSSFVGNTVPNGGYGGAIMMANSPALITNSTFSGNTATGGGGLNITNPSAIVTVTNSTFSGNTAAAGLGGGVRRGSGTLTLRNTIVANSAGGGDCMTAGTAPVFANSLVEDGTCSIVNGTNGNKTGDPALGALTNGYYPLTIGSRAQDAGNNNFLSEATTSLDYNGDGDTGDTIDTDQAGENRVFNTTVDMGAVELIVRDFVVDRTDDAVVDDCTTAANDCTLRGAITFANALSGTDIITFNPTVFDGTPATNITLGSALPNITTPMTIDGSGTGGVTISGVDTHRPFFIQNAAATLQALTIRDGAAPGGQGGAIHVAGTSSVTLRRVTVTSSTANFGAGIYNNSGNTLFVFDSRITGNHANNNGGGVLNAGVMYMLNSAVLDNSANSQGGGVMSTSSANLTNVTVTGNSANTAAGIYLSNGTSTLTNITVAGNTATNQIGGVERFSGTVVVRNSIFANNTGVDCYHTMSVTNSLVETQSGTFPCGVTNGVNGNVVGQDPQLSARLGDYFLPNAGSPALDTGNNFFVSEADSDGAGTVDNVIDFNGDGDTTDTLDTDQRGTGFDRIVNTTVDMGATEFEAPDFVVDRTDDALVAGCSDAANDCTLRGAITLANALSGTDTITFDAAVFAAPGPYTIQLTSALPDLASAININGPGARVLSVRGEDTDENYRIFTITAGATVNISGLTVTNGHAADGVIGPSNNNGDLGGGIRNDGTLTLTGVAVSGNQAGKGGGSPTLGGSGGNGGGVYNVGMLTVSNSTISGNQTGTAGNATAIPFTSGQCGHGGGIYNVGTLTISNSTISGNLTPGGGGGGGQGGGVNSNSASPLTISNSTITANTANGSDGGGIHIFGSGVATLRSTIVAGNTSGSAPDISGTVQSEGYNFIGNTNGTTVNETANTGTNITGNPQLASLANNGGQTDTHALLFGSPAIDKGNAFGSTTDQRGAGFSRIFSDPFITDASDGADIGAFEVQTAGPPPIPNLSIDNVSKAEGNAGTSVYTFNVSLSFAATAPVTFDIATADFNATDANDDYEPRSLTGQSISTGQTAYQFDVTVNGDTTTEADEVFRVNVSNVSGANVADAQGDGTILNDDGAPAPGQLLISEFRLRGPVPTPSPAAGNEQGQLDEYVELYNNTDAEIIVIDSSPLGGAAPRGWALVSSGAPGVPKFVVPAGTKIPARGHYLVANSVGYSLGAYPAGDATTATPDGTYTVDISDGEGLALFRTADAALFSDATQRLDAVGFQPGAAGFFEGTPLALTGANSGEYAWLRSITSVRPQDTGDNVSDFRLVATNGGTYGTVQAVLGAPGPENLSSPVEANTKFAGALLDQTASQSTPPNRSRDFASDPANNSTFGTLIIRRRLTNNTGAPVTRLRLRVINVAGYPVQGPSMADLRVRTSTDSTVMNIQDAATCAASGETAPCSVTVRGLTVETPSAQPSGGGLNTTLGLSLATPSMPPPPVKTHRPVKDYAVELSTPLANGESVNIQFLVGIQKTGNFRYILSIEAVP